MDSEIGDKVVTVVTVEFAVVGDGDGDVDEVFGISVLADIIWHKHTVFNFSQKKKKEKKTKRILWYKVVGGSEICWL